MLIINTGSRITHRAGPIIVRSLLWFLGAFLLGLFMVCPLFLQMEIWELKTTIIAGSQSETNETTDGEGGT